jgi:hypothetical protein
VLQVGGAEGTEHIVRARGPWFGNRSISAEVDLPAGIYDVLPKIEASRYADHPDVHEVVTKVAERNPQKLRQIGLNYDIANAKALTELTEEEEKEKERKDKEAAEKKRKKLEEEEKEKADFEAWKKEEKAEYEAWKKEKGSREGGVKPRVATSTTEVQHAEPKKDTSSATVKNAEEVVASPATVAEPGKDQKAGLPKIKSDGDTSADEEPQHTPDDEANRFFDAPCSTAEDPATYHTRHGAFAEISYASHPEDAHGDVSHPPRPPPHSNHAAPDNAPKPWNAVCVIGLRVYSQDPEVSIKLVKPKNAEEAALLDVGGDTAAGATM